MRRRSEVTEKEVQDFMDMVLEHRGYVYPFQEFSFRRDPEFARASYEWYKQVRAEKWLPLKYKELLFVTAACLGRHERGLRTHIKKALELGATPEEIIETIQVASHTGGGGISVLAVRILHEYVTGEPLPLEPAWKGKR